MNKFIDAIRVLPHHPSSFKMKEIPSGTLTSSYYINNETRRIFKYELEAKFYAFAELDFFPRTPNELEVERNIHNDLVRILIEEIFGEFRVPINQIRLALLQNNNKLAMERLTDLTNRMFEI
jgi:hypothetical protein